MAKKPHIELSPETHKLLKKYCLIKGEKLSPLGDKIIKDFLQTQHVTFESEGEMSIEEEKPKTIIEILKGE